MNTFSASGPIFLASTKRKTLQSHLTLPSTPTSSTVSPTPQQQACLPLRKGLKNLKPEQFYGLNSQLIVWAPKIYFNHLGQAAAVRCPLCSKPAHVHGWGQHLRRICALNGVFFLVGTRYICRNCEGKLNAHSWTDGCSAVHGAVADLWLSAAAAHRGNTERHNMHHNLLRKGMCCCRAEGWQDLHARPARGGGDRGSTSSRSSSGRGHGRQLSCSCSRCCASSHTAASKQAARPRPAASCKAIAAAKAAAAAA